MNWWIFKTEKADVYYAERAESVNILQDSFRLKIVDLYD
jgi:hypothetical protein